MTEPEVKQTFLDGKWFTSFKGVHPCGIKVGFFDESVEKPDETHMNKLKSEFYAMMALPKDELRAKHKADMLRLKYVCHCDYCESHR